MLRARILMKNRYWRKKWVLRGKRLFYDRKTETEYQVEPLAVYNERWGPKLIQVIDFVEGCRLPLSFGSDEAEAAYLEITQETPIDEITMTISRSLKNIVILISCICSAGALLVGIAIALKVFGAMQ